MMHNDLTSIIRDNKVIFIVGDDIDNFSTNLLSCFNNKFPENVLMIHDFAIERLNRKYYDDVVNKIMNVCTTRSSEYATLNSHGKTFRNNNLHNIKHVVVHPHINVLRDIFKDRPAVLVAAGPSLDKNLHELKNKDRNVVIICVATALKKLLKEGIKPHFITTIDASEASQKYLKNLPIDDIPLVADMECYSKIIEEYKGPVFLWPPEKPINFWLQSKIKNFKTERKGATVSHLSFFLGEVLGCNHLIMIGHDLAYSGKKGHAEGCNEVWGEEDFSKNRYLKSIKSWDESTVLSDGGFITFLTLFEKIINESKSKIIDATEGGAYKNNTERITLKEALDVHCTEQFDIQQTTNILYKNSNRTRKDEFKDIINQLLKEYNESELLLTNIIEMGNSIIKAVKNGRDLNKVQEMTNKFLALYTKVYNIEWARSISEVTLIGEALAVQAYYDMDYQGNNKFMHIVKLYKMSSISLKNDMLTIKESLLNTIKTI